MRHAARICSQPGCPEIAIDRGRCASHAAQQYERAMIDRREYDEQRLSRHERGYGSEWDRQRARYLKTHPFCFVCGEPATDVDHIVPRSQGGSEDDDNKQALCHICHSRKTAGDIRGDGGRWQKYERR